jgi:hypothetical protein
LFTSTNASPARDGRSCGDSKRLTHYSHSPAQHTPLLQLAPFTHPYPVSQSGQDDAPQSMPVSAPFCTPSMHVESWQVNPSQEPIRILGDMGR